MSAAPHPRDPWDESNEVRVACIVLNWNGWPDTLACVESLRAQTARNLRVWVVDNGSTDESVGRIRAGAPWVTVIEAGANVGFSRGNNIGIRHALAAGAEAVWLLNNDTMAPPDTLTKLTEAAHMNPGAGIIGSVLYYAHDPMRVQAWGGGHVQPSFALSRHYTTATAFDSKSYATFASVLIRKEVFGAIGFLYEGTFMYFEDADFCLRALHKGWTIAVAADTAVLHKEGGSARATESLRMVQAVTVAGLRFIRRHGSFGVATLPVFVAMRVAKRMLRGQFAAARAVVAGAAEYVRTPVDRDFFQP